MRLQRIRLDDWARLNYVSNSTAQKWARSGYLHTAKKEKGVWMVNEDQAKPFRARAPLPVHRNYKYVAWEYNPLTKEGVNVDTDAQDR